MQIQRLLLTDFRSCAQLNLEPAPGINIFTGANAQGKSTLLEAIYLLATSRSPRAGKDGELVRWGQDYAIASAAVKRDQRGDVDLEVSLSRTERRVMRINHTRRARILDLVGQLNAVLFSSEDLDIVRGEPSARRRFLNLSISQVSPHYCHGLLQYRKVLEQRNRLLKMMKETGRDSDTLAVWNDQLVAAGSRLVERRIAFLSELQQYAGRVYADLAGAGEQLEISYVPSFSVEGASSVADAFRACLEPLARDEVARGTTLLGPHRDDVVFSINGADVRVFGSQGQQRSVALAVRLSEVELMSERAGEPPVLLLDDAGSELDEARRGRLFALVTGGYQTFVTCTDTAALPAALLDAATRYVVVGGQVSRCMPVENLC